MKACRVIKIIAFVLALLILAVAVAGNALVIKDAVKYNDDGRTVCSVKDCYLAAIYTSDSDVSVSSIINDLKDAEFKLLPDKTPAAESDDVKLETASMVNTTENEVTDDVISEASEAAEATEASDVTAAPEATEEPVAVEVATECEPADVKDYSLSNYHYLLVTMMKAATHRIDVKFLSEMSEFKEYGFTVNTCLVISLGLLFVCFILHCISKNVRKTVWGLILMLVGYVMFMAFTLAGQYAANCSFNLFSSWDQYDQNTIRILLVAAFMAIGFIFGIAYYRCGSRQMVMKALKQEVRKLKRRARAK